jgi:glycerate 2-kinase
MIDAMRDEARRLFGVALAAAEPGAAVRQALAAAPVEARRVWIVAVGKAARSMAEAAKTQLASAGGDPGRVVTRGPIAGVIVVTNAENASPLGGAELHVAGHPVPDEGGLRAAEALEAMLRRTAAEDVVLALISGGGSALLPAPVAGLTLADKAEANRLMLGAGLDITEVNMVRQHLSRLKGGGLARAAAPARVVALILSDVIGDDLRVIASGPTVEPICTRAEARALLERRGLWARMPEGVWDVLSRPENVSPPPAAENRLIGSNCRSLEAMAGASGGAIWSKALVGDVGDAANCLVGRMRAAPAGRVLAFCGGETTVNLRGQGRGGRNQELALRVAAGMEGVTRPWVFLSGGTDGRDGPTDAAGGLVDGGTLSRIAAAGGAWRALLEDNDSHRALGLSGDLLVTGGTGTNVADVQIVILG